MMVRTLQPENLPPVSNQAPGETITGKAAFLARTVADLQVATVFRHLRPWIARQEGRLLEVGCGAQPYRHLVPPCCTYTGLDTELAGEGFHYRQPETVYYTGDSFPLSDASFDCLFHTEVLEHVYRPQAFLTECHRVLKPGATMFLTVPFQARYHYIPHDYFRYTPAALKRMLEEVGFRNITITPRGTDITVAAYKNLSVIFRWLRGGLVGKLAGLLALPLVAPLLLTGWFSLLLGVGSPDDCLGYSVTAQVPPVDNYQPSSPEL